MNRSILVAYASSFSTTAEVADVIGIALRDATTHVTMQSVLDADDPEQYDAVVLGSPIYNGQWLPEAAYWLQAQQEALRRMPVAFFLTCMVLYQDTPTSRRTAAAYAQTVRQLAPTVQPIDTGMFAGCLRYRNLAPLERTRFWLVSRLPSGDFRDPRAMRTWAARIGPLLLAPVNRAR